MSNEKEIQDTDEVILKGLSHLQNGVNFYNEHRDENEVDMVSEVRLRLIEAGASDALLSEVYDNNRFIKEAAGKHAHAQQYNLNRFFNGQLNAAEAETGTDTRLLRYQLMYEVNPREWLTVFDKGILLNTLELGLRKLD